MLYSSLAVLQQSSQLSVTEKMFDFVSVLLCLGKYKYLAKRAVGPGSVVANKN
jgi:hypothetical protein